MIAQRSLRSSSTRVLARMMTELELRRLELADRPTPLVVYIHGGGFVGLALFTGQAFLYNAIFFTYALVLTAVSMHVPKAPLPTGFFVEKPPENAKDVSEARRAGGEGTLKAGDEVVSGEAALALKTGRLALGVDGKRVKVETTQDGFSLIFWLADEVHPESPSPVANEARKLSRGDVGSDGLTRFVVE